MQLTPGIRGEARRLVTPAMTARAIGSGGLEVLATPLMLALMEEAALLSVRPCLAPGTDTVGTRLDVAHLAATPVGMEVRAESELLEVDRRRLVFAVRAYDGAGLIGEGRHERFVVDVERFTAKCEAKKG